jgi:hypothetical protein
VLVRLATLTAPTGSRLHSATLRYTHLDPAVSLPNHHI